MAKLTKKQVVGFAREFNKVFELDNPIDLKGDQGSIETAIAKEVDALYVADEAKLSKPAWKYATTTLGLTPEDAKEPPAAAAPKGKGKGKGKGKAAPTETAAEKKARVKAEKEAKKEAAAVKKAEAKAKREADKVPKYKRHDAACEAITKLCAKKAGATIEDIMVESDKLFVKNGGTSYPGAEKGAMNVHRYILIGLERFGVVTKDDNKAYHLAT